MPGSIIIAFESSIAPVHSVVKAPRHNAVRRLEDGGSLEVFVSGEFTVRTNTRMNNKGGVRKTAFLLNRTDRLESISISRWG